nr:unnamed protein product [Digitaria exilis]
MDSAKRSTGVAGLPDDVLVEILSLLPAKFLYRSKCVSKAWLDLITDRLCCGKKLPLTLEGFFYGYGSNDDGWGSNKDDEDCLNSPDEVDGCFINLLGKPSPLLDASLSFLRNQQPSSEVDFEYLANYNCLTLLDSCNGLLLFAKNTRDTRLVFPNIPQGYIVCNPATEHWVHVPSSGFPMTRWGGSSDDDGESDDELWEMSYETHLIFDPAVSSHFQLIELCVGCEGTAVTTFSSETKHVGK